METNLANLHLTFIGCGVMAESIVAGLLRKSLVKPEQEPARGISGKIRHRSFREKYGSRRKRQIAGKFGRFFVR
jgi:pyrroline-5-carboxylate reductase